MAVEAKKKNHVKVTVADDHVAPAPPAPKSSGKQTKVGSFYTNSNSETCYRRPKYIMSSQKKSRSTMWTKTKSTKY